MKKKFLFVSMLLIVLCTLSAVSANEINNTDELSISDNGDSVLSTNDVTVSDWSSLSNYCGQTSGDYTINLNGSITPGSKIQIKNSVTIIGNANSYIGGSENNIASINDGFANIPFYTNTVGLSVTFKDVNFQYINGNILMQFSGNGNYKLENCTFKNIITSGGKESVVYLQYGFANITDCTFTNCAAGYGTITNCYSSSESTAYRASMVVDNCNFKNNQAILAPGAINNCGYLEVYDSTFENNRAVRWAGAIHTHANANTTIVNSTFRKNFALWNGGALYTYSDLQVYNSTFDENTCNGTFGGGAIGACAFAEQNVWTHVWTNSTYNIMIKNSQFRENVAVNSNGGDIAVMDKGILRVQNNTFADYDAAGIRSIYAVESVIYNDNWTDIGSPTVEIVNNKFYDLYNTNIAEIVYDVNTTYLDDNNDFYLSNNAQSQNSEFLLGLSANDVLGGVGDAEYPAQWNQEGHDAQNTAISPYGGIPNAAEAWNYTITNNGNINSLLINNAGDIFFNTNNGYVLRLDKSGNVLVNTRYGGPTTGLPMIETSGVVFNDDNLFFMIGDDNEINPPVVSYDFTNFDMSNYMVTGYATTDMNGGPIWSQMPVYGATMLSPILFNNDVYVIMQGNKISKMYLDMDGMPFSNEMTGEMFSLYAYQPENIITSSTPLSSPVISNDGKSLWINTENGIEGYDLSTKSKYAITSVSAVGRPIIDANDVVYFIGSDDKLYAYTTTGEKWSTEISGGAGSLLALGKDGNIYTVSKEGFLLQFSPDGDDTSLYEIGTNASSIMTDANNIIYIGGEDGKFYAVSGDKLKWSVDTESASAIKYVAMDNSGIIYFATDKTVYATLEAPVILKNVSIEVSIPEGNYSIFDEVTITATLNETVEGNVTFTAGDLIQVVAVNGNTTEWTTALPAGNQTVTATFEGDGYETAIGTATVNIAKADVEFEKVPEVLTYDSSKSSQLSFNFNILSNGANVTTGTIAGYDENNNKLSGIWRYYANRGWTATIRNVAPGYHNITIVYSGDSNYNGANTTFELISLPTVSSSVSVVDDEITVDVSVSGTDASGKFTVVCNNETLAEGNIENGAGSVTFDKLEPGTYEFQIIYEGNEFIPANNGTATLKIPRTSQWASVGGDAQNSGNSIATREDGVSILWNASLEGDLVYSAVIDSFGNIYVTDGINLYSFANDGTLIWSVNVENQWAPSGSSGIALYHDEAITSPQQGNAMLIFNATDGSQFSGNYWSASSAFAPIVGPDGRVYTPSEYGYPADGQGWSGNYWVSVLSESGNEWEPYQFNLFLVEITGVEYMSPGMKDSPSFDNQGYIYANTVKGFKIVNIATGTTVFSDPNINGVGRPVVDANNIAYILDEGLDGIYAISAEGIVWNTTVTDGIGSTLAVDNENGFLYTVNAEGTLYKYSTTDGSETKVYDLNSTGVSIILDADNNVYVSTDAGDVVALSADGELLWTINLGSQITGQLAMDYNGIIYAVADETLYALGYATNLSVEAENTTVFDNNIIAVSVVETATGNVTIFVNDDEYKVPIEDGTATLDLGKLPLGDYNVTVVYDGDATHSADYAETAFEVTKADAEIIPDVVSTIEETTIALTLPEDATGRVFVKVDGKGYFAEVEEGMAVITILGLESGNYTAEVTYEGDDNYNNASIEVDINVPELADPELDVSVNGTVVTVSLDEMAVGYVVVSVDGDDLFFEYEGDPIVVDFADLEPGNYTIYVTYSGDDFFAAAEDSVDVTVPEEPVVEPKDSELKVDIQNTTITVTINENATGDVIITVGDISFVQDAAELAPVDVSNYLTNGTYPVTVEYVGDDVFAEKTLIGGSVTVPEEPVVEPKDSELKVDIQNTTVSVSINENATGDVIITVGDISFVQDAGELAPVDVSNYLTNGTYPVTVEYVGDDVFAEKTLIGGSVTVPEEPVVEPKDPNLKASVEDTTVSVTVDKDATGYVVVDVDGTGYYAEIDNGQAVVSIPALRPGSYNADVTYAGDENYKNATVSVSIVVPDEPVVEPKDPNLKASVEDTTVSVTVDKDATGYVVVDVDGTGYYAEIEDGQAVVSIPALRPGSYNAHVTYAGDENYKNASTTVSITVPDEPVVEPKDPNLKAAAVNNTITATVDKDATGSIMVDVDGQGYYAPIKDGKAVINVIGLDEGKYNAVVSYVGDDTFKAANATVSITVPKKEDPQPEPVDPKADIKVSNETVSVDLPKDATGYLLVDVDGKGYYAPVKDGKATLDLPELAPGNHTVTVTYTGDKKYDSANATQTITVEDDIHTVIAENLTKVEKAPGRFEAVFTDAKGNPLANTDVTFELNGQKYTRTTDANGKAGMAINLVAGNYTIVTTNPVTKESVTNTITVLPRIESSDLTKYFKNASQFLVKVFDDEGNPVKAGEVVTFNINGVFYNRTTDSNGMAKLSINLIAGNYTITTEYKGCKAANNIEVLPILTAKDLTKKYGQTGAFEATLVDSQGKPYANQQVEFNINGVFYKRTTGSNGVAKLNINLQAGEYIITSSYNGFNIANKVTVTA